MEPGPVERSRR